MVTSRLNKARSGKTLYGARGQELPAVYTNAAWYKLVTYCDTEPFTSGEIREVCNKENGRGWPWEIFFPTESWAAFVDDNDYGLGVYNGQTNRFCGGFCGEIRVHEIDMNGVDSAYVAQHLSLLPQDTQKSIHFISLIELIKRMIDACACARSGTRSSKPLAVYVGFYAKKMPYFLGDTLPSIFIFQKNCQKNKNLIDKALPPC